MLLRDILFHPIVRWLITHMLSNVIEKKHHNAGQKLMLAPERNGLCTVVLHTI